jgi:predicted acyl esterase
MPAMAPRRKSAPVDFGNKLPFDLNEEILRWYDSLLKGMGNGLDHEKSVKIFVMGKNDWREEDDWPLGRAKATRYYLHSAKPANGLDGGGTLSTAAPAEEKTRPIRVRSERRGPHNWRTPLLRAGGCHRGVGPEDQRPPEARGDVLVFSSPAFTQNAPKLQVRFRSTCMSVVLRSTQTLRENWLTSGRTDLLRNLTEGILRMRYPRFTGETGTCKSAGDLSHQPGSLGNEQCFPARTQTAARGFQQQFPAI